MFDFGAWIRQLDYAYALNLLLSTAAALICITVHESAHGLVAYWLGDPTAKNRGRISLNPIKHVDVIGLVMLAIAHVGWAKPVPIDMRNFKNPKVGMAISAAAGPISNLLLAFVSLTVCWVCYAFVSWDMYYLMMFLYQLTIINCGLAVFNIIPIPPLDGSKVLFSLLPQTLYAKLMYVERYGMFLLIALVYFGAVDGILNRGIDLVVNGMCNLILNVSFALS